MKQYIPEKMAAQSRYRRHFPTLPADVRAASKPACAS